MLNILIIVAAFLIAVVLARIIIPRILIISLRKRLFDTPDARKVHKKPVSRLGGVSFFPAILFTVTFLIGICYMTGWVSLVDTGQHWVQILFMCTGLTLLYIVGIADDLIGVRYRQKFIVQLIAAFMFPLAGLYINDFYGLFGINALIHLSSMTASVPKTDNATILSPDAKPSMPSIRLMALVIKITSTKVRGIPMKGETA